METAQYVIQVINNVGFPIAVCIACFWYINKQSEQHKEEMTKLNDALNNNTIALTQLTDKLEGVN